MIARTANLVPQYTAQPGYTTWPATEEVAKRLRAGQLVVLESTTYPGTTEDLLVPAATGGGTGGKVGLMSISAAG